MAVQDVREVPEGTPGEVAERAEKGLDAQRHPSTSSTLGIEVGVPNHGTPKHRLVVIGDSLSHGFQSGAIFNTDISYPAIIARELGWTDYRYPTYGKGPGEGDAKALGGFPLNIEYLLRRLEDKLGEDINPLELPKAVGIVHQFLDEVEDYWERGPGNDQPAHDYVHDLSVYGWTLRDALTTTYGACHDLVSAHSKDNLANEFVESATQRAALRVYPNQPEGASTRTVFDVARDLGADPQSEAESGIETLIIMLGANNALPTVTDLRVEWTDDAYGTAQEFARVTQKLTSADGKRRRLKTYTVSRPDHFRNELAQVVEQVKQINARHVIWCTVPHVTIAPIAHGIPPKKGKDSRYFDFYVRPWIETDDDFRRDRDEHLTAAEARVVDSAVDFFNDAIEQVVRDARTGSDGEAPRDWRIFELYGLLEGLASRRFDSDGDPTAAVAADADDPGLKRPAWLPIYPLPQDLLDLEDPAAGTSRPNTAFLSANGEDGRASGGLFSLDGVHPTTVAYGIIAQELINIMSDAKVPFLDSTGQPRQAPIKVDFARLITEDSLVTSPPQNIATAKKWARAVVHTYAAAKRLLGLEERIGPITDVVAPGSQRSA